MVGGKICLRQGLLEMFACPEGTKEHESIVSVNAKAQTVHTALLAVGLAPANLCSTTRSTSPPAALASRLMLSGKTNRVKRFGARHNR